MLDQILKSDLLEQANRNADLLGVAIMAAIIVIGLVVIITQRAQR